MTEEMTEEQARAIIVSVTGMQPDSDEVLECASDIGHALLDAVCTLGGAV